MTTKKVNTSIEFVAAWSQLAQTREPQESTEVALEARLDSVSIMVNDFSNATGPTPFETHSVDIIKAFADTLRENDIDVSLTSWIMPHEEFIREAADQLLVLVEETQASQLVWDAEGSWVNAEDHMGFAAAAALIGELFADVSDKLGLTGQGRAPIELRELAEICPWWYPQAYATEGGQHDPNNIVNFSVSQWRNNYGNSGQFIMGLAAYNQPSPPEPFMQPCIDQVESHAITQVCYWDVGAIGRRDDVRAFIADLGPPLRDLPDRAFPNA